MRAKNDRKIQKNSLKVVKSILLRLDSDFLFNPQLYKSLSYTLLHSSFDVQVLSLECLKLIFDYADQQIENILMQMMNEEIVETIFELIGLSDDASILSTSILLTLIRRCPNSPCSCFVQQKLCDPSLYNQIEEITLSENSIVATHASMLLKYVPFEE